MCSTVGEKYTFLSVVSFVYIPVRESAIPDALTWDIGHRTWEMGHLTWDMGHGTLDTKHGAWYMGHGIWDMEHSTWDLRNSGSRICPHPVIVKFSLRVTIMGEASSDRGKKEVKPLKYPN